MKKLFAKISWKSLLAAVPAGLFILFIFVFLGLNLLGTTGTRISQTTAGRSGLASLSTELESYMQENFARRTDFIDLNGLTYRLLGINSLNGREKLANGFLSQIFADGNITEYKTVIALLDEYLEAREIPFLYVLAPNKNNIYDAEAAPGYTLGGIAMRDEMLRFMEEEDIDYLNMNARFQAEGWTMEDVFFQTDHHWRPEAALEAARCTMGWLEEQGLADYGRELLEEESWNKTVLKNWFLGSSGKFTGQYYTGVDDITMYEPLFDTDYTYSIPVWDTVLNEILDRSYAEEPRYYQDSPYSMYMFGDPGLRITQNPEAMNDKRLLLMGDSFKMPYEYFLTTQFQEVVTIDLRYTSAATTAQFIAEYEPDVVILCTYNVASITTHVVGMEEFLAAREETLASPMKMKELGDVWRTYSESSHNFTVIESGLIPGQDYTLYTDATRLFGGNDELHIQLVLQDLTTNTAVLSRYLDANSAEMQKWYFTTPEDEHNYAIYLYAGTNGYTENISVKLSDVRLQTGVGD